MSDVADQTELDEFIDLFEAAHAAGDEIDLRAFLPPDNHPQYCKIAAELVRVDLEHRWRRGCARPLNAYEAFVAPVFGDVVALSDVAFEEYRLRRQSGEIVEIDEYRRRFGVDTSGWPVGENIRRPTGDSIELAHIAAQAEGWVDAVVDAPNVGGQFAGFELVEELGRGSFGRVYLARQGSLAGRHVVLKITAPSSVEPDSLARLQHTNIVPIYSVHYENGRQAICMPFFGRETLAKALARAQVSMAESQSADALLGTNTREQDETLPDDGTLSEPSTTVPTRRGPLSTDDCRVVLPPRTAADCSRAVRIIRDVAAGLAHAHERNLIHRDLKPANILLTDDGRPMILDFNLSDEVVPGGRAGLFVGGTLPYMSPEHLRAVDRGGDVGFSDDVYSLGVVLFELLAGQRPFPSRRGAFDDVIEQMIDDRRSDLPKRSLRNFAASPDLESIVLKCLDPVPRGRYQHAGELHEDLEAHLGDAPLKHAPNRSLPERIRKWCRRHPRIASVTGVATILGAAIVLVAALFVARGHRLATLEAKQQLATFEKSADNAELLLCNLQSDVKATLEGIESARAAMADYHVLENSAWRDAPTYQLLEASDKETLGRRLADLCYLLADAEIDASGDLTEAIALNNKATDLGAPHVSRAVLVQQARLLDQRGAFEHAEELRSKANQLPLRDGRDRYLAARDAFHNEDWQTAMREIERALEDRPLDPAVWFGKANVHVALQELAEAEHCFSVCVGLAPDFYLAYMQRGLQRLEMKMFEPAIADFDRVLQLRPGRTDALVNRALALQGLGQLSRADRDLTDAINQGVSETRVYFIRAGVRRALGDVNAAQTDRQTGISLEPTDEKSWLARGMSRLSHDPKAALADFEEASRRYPGSVDALRNMAYVRAEKLKDLDGALDALNQILEIQPKNVLARAGRGVFLARLGQRDEALADATAALRSADDAKTMLQAASAFALTSKTHSGDADHAFNILAAALRKEPRLARLVDQDPDLAPLRDDPRFNEVLAAARLLGAPIRVRQLRRNSLDQ